MSCVGRLCKDYLYLYNSLPLIPTPPLIIAVNMGEAVGCPLPSKPPWSQCSQAYFTPIYVQIEYALSDCLDLYIACHADYNHILYMCWLNMSCCTASNDWSAWNLLMLNISHFLHQYLHYLQHYSHAYAYHFPQSSVDWVCSFLGIPLDSCSISRFLATMRYSLILSS